MSDRVLIEELAAAGVVDEPYPLWTGWPGARSRWEEDGEDGFLIYSPRAGGVFHRSREFEVLAMTDSRKAIISSDIYFANQRGVIPRITALIEQAGDDRPGHRGRMDLLVQAIAGAEDPEVEGLELGRRRPER